MLEPLLTEPLTKNIQIKDVYHHWQYDIYLINGINPFFRDGSYMILVYQGHPITGLGLGPTTTTTTTMILVWSLVSKYRNFVEYVQLLIGSRSHPLKSIGSMEPVLTKPLYAMVVHTTISIILRFKYTGGPNNLLISKAPCQGKAFQALPSF